MSALKPLPSLLWTVLRGLEQTYIDLGAGRGTMPSLDLWANLLRALDDAGVDRRDLPTLTRLSKRAVRSRIATAVRKGWAEEAKFATAQTLVRLTAAGSAVSKQWKVLHFAAEEHWRANSGSDLADALRASLEVFVASLPLELPHYPASYGAADASITGGGGQDWKPVLRTSEIDSVSSLPLSALLSQAIVAFAMRYEEISPVAMTLSTTVICRIPPEGRPLKGLRDSVGISALDRHGFVRLSGSRGDETIQLTVRGLEVHTAYSARIEQVESEWQRQMGDEALSAFREALTDAAARQSIVNT